MSAAAGVCSISVAGNSLSAARARSLSPSSAAWRRATVGACSSRLVKRVREDIEHRVRILARGELRCAFASTSRAGAVAMRAQALERHGARAGGVRFRRSARPGVSMIASAASAASRRLRRLSSTARRGRRRCRGTRRRAWRPRARCRAARRGRPATSAGACGAPARRDLRAPHDRPRLAVAENTMSTSARWRSISLSGSAMPPWRLREFLRVRQRAVGDQQALDLRLREMARDQFDGFAGADQQHRRIGGPCEGFLRQPHRGRRHRHRIGADAGVGARALGGDEGLLEQAVELPAERARARAPRSRPASPGRGSAARRAPSNRARWRRGTDGAPRRRRWCR